MAAFFLALLSATPAGALPAWPSLSQGVSGADTQTAQYLLRHHGYGIAADGQFGPATGSAVVSFQSARGLTADGTIGSETWPHLIVSVSQGASGDAVRAAQLQLNLYGAGLPVDGQFGPVTDSAVRSYQSSHGLAVDGRVGSQTWQSLVGGNGGGGTPSGYSLPLARTAVGRADYAASHWNSTPAVDLIVSYLPAYAIKGSVVDHYDSASCGIGIRLLQPDGSRFVYCHLSARSVADGAQVVAGTRVGTTGDTGNSGAPHLHVEIRTSDGVARCPQSYLLAIYDGRTPPSLGSLPTSGCTA
ncbi:peptidoglycan-binding protein [Streptomyces sp. NBC_01637]|uniref:peptidoglycan-binding protein n=1 Tax=unclassified Streptomyces TaxID=2593676 RepID=UPI00386427C4|nr:peptidoglycan-binding protein [Streptomyces sp. NBC_01653]WTD37627.1 peptidoglycan-binding protein [Streptomyces sp. NBC_01643]WTD93041.1 peptidoglycan-binding protein [Streptomyces sp. NBC_01637]